MSLIKCPECENVISNKAITCPQCGFPISRTKKYNKIKFVLYVAKRYILNFFVKLSIQFKKILDSKRFLFLVVFPIMICIIITVCLFWMWLMEQLFEFNSTVGLVTLFFSMNILNWFASYKWGASKLLFWLGLIITITFLYVVWHFYLRIIVLKGE